MTRDEIAVTTKGVTGDTWGPLLNRDIASYNDDSAARSWRAGDRARVQNLDAIVTVIHQHRGWAWVEGVPGTQGLIVQSRELELIGVVPGELVAWRKADIPEKILRVQAVLGPFAWVRLADISDPVHGLGGGVVRVAELDDSD